MMVSSLTFFEPVELDFEATNFAIQVLRLLVLGNRLRATTTLKQRAGLVLYIHLYRLTQLKCNTS